MRRISCVVILMLLVSFTTLQAQDMPKAELFGGYSYAGEGSNGFDTSIAGNVNDWFGLVADVSGQYTRLEEEGIREKIRTNSYLFGPRFSLRKNQRVTPFAHALFGVSHVKSEAIELGQTFAFSDTSFGMALGGGLDVTVNDNLAIRVAQVDYLRTRFFNQTQNEGRIAVGVVLRFGKK